MGASPLDQVSTLIFVARVHVPNVPNGILSCAWFRGSGLRPSKVSKSNPPEVRVAPVALRKRSHWNQVFFFSSEKYIKEYRLSYCFRFYCYYFAFYLSLPNLLFVLFAYTYMKGKGRIILCRKQKNTSNTKPYNFVLLAALARSPSGATQQTEQKELSSLHASTVITRRITVPACFTPTQGCPRLLSVITVI